MTKEVKKAVEDVRDKLPRTTSPLRAIRNKCLDCTCNSPKEVELCPIAKCSLYPFRFGNNPFRKERSEAQKEATRKAFEKLRAKNAEGALDG